jgi:hypothetical protein
MWRYNHGDERFPLLNFGIWHMALEQSWHFE